MNQEETDEYFDYDTILNRMLSRIPDTIDKREGSIIYDAISPAAAELSQLYIKLKYNVDLLFADTSVADYLDRLCGQFGLTRKKATSAIKKGTFYNLQDELMEIDIGSRFTCENLYWKVIEKISKGTYQLQCETVGIIGNNIVGNLIPIDYINDLATATLTDLLVPGENEETDDELRYRYNGQIEEQAFGGNVADYKNKTKNIVGVGAVKVIPVWNGGGTVKLIILDSNYSKASNVLIEEVQNAICPNSSNEGAGIAPIRT